MRRVSAGRSDRLGPNGHDHADLDHGLRADRRQQSRRHRRRSWRRLPRQRRPLPAGLAAGPAPASRSSRRPRTASTISTSARRRCRRLAGDERPVLAGGCLLLRFRASRSRPHPFFVPPTTVVHENTAWAVFGNVSYDVSGNLTLTGGLRYTDDDKDFSAIHRHLPVAPVSASDEQVSRDFSALYRYQRPSTSTAGWPPASAPRPFRDATSHSSVSRRLQTRRPSPRVSLASSRTSRTVACG